MRRLGLWNDSTMKAKNLQMQSVPSKRDQRHKNPKETEPLRIIKGSLKVIKEVSNYTLESKSSPDTQSIHVLLLNFQPP